MCLLVFSYRSHPRYPFLFAGNRDEFHERPAQPAHFWDEPADLLAGRDLKAGGTWLGVDRKGRFATVTNYREPNGQHRDARSRGEIVTDFLQSTGSPEDFLDALESRGAAYTGFNLILGDAGALYYMSNRGDAARRLMPGEYGLSNGRLDTPWPKVRRAKMLFQRALERDEFDTEALLDMLADEERPPDDELPVTGIGLAWERRLSTIFISGREYGTRASTVVVVDRDGELTFVERSFGPGGEEMGTAAFRITIERVADTTSGRYGG